VAHFGKLLQSLDLSEFRVNWLVRHCGTTAGHVPQVFPHVENCQRADSGTAIGPFVLYHGCQEIASMQQLIASILRLDRRSLSLQAMPVYMRKSSAFPMRIPKSLRLCRRSPIDLIEINDQRFLVVRTPMPLPSARVMILVRMLDQTCANRIQVDIIHLLNKRVFACNAHRVRVKFVHRMLMLIFALLDSKFGERRFKSVVFQMIDNSLCRDAVDRSKDFFAPVREKTQHGEW
jgi:hypothetical protein